MFSRFFRLAVVAFPLNFSIEKGVYQMDNFKFINLTLCIMLNIIHRCDGVALLSCPVIVMNHFYLCNEITILIPIAIFLFSCCNHFNKDKIFLIHLTVDVPFMETT